MKAYYDLHVHSCLSPCGDEDSTPFNLVNMAKLKGLDLFALTDHNTCRNCPAALKAGEEAGILVLPGMELCTAEDIHMVCLFPGLAQAAAFEEKIAPLRPPVKNRPDIYGPQLLCDEKDEVVGQEDTLLITAASIGIIEARALALSFGGAAFPAHADKTANGIIAVLGAIPPEAGFTAAELSPRCDASAFVRAHGMEGLRILRDSDAHYLGDISEREHFLELGELSPENVIRLLNTPEGSR